MIGELKRLLPGFSISESTDKISIWLPGDQEMDVTIKRKNSTFLIIASKRNHHFTIIFEKKARKKRKDVVEWGYGIY